MMQPETRRKMTGHQTPVVDGYPHTIQVDDETRPAILARVTAAILDEDPNALVHWLVEHRLTSPAVYQREFGIANDGARLLMRRRREGTTFNLSVPFDGRFRFSNAPRLFEPGDAA